MDGKAALGSNYTDAQETTASSMMEEIWARRAAQMAQVETPPQTGEQVLGVVICLGRELFALDVQFVTDIRPKEAISRIPRVPAWLTGVMNLRGRILSVVDLRKYLGLPEDTSTTSEGLLIVAENKDMEIVFLVDDVPGVEILPLCEKGQESILHGLRSEYILGIAEQPAKQNSTARVMKQHVTILNANALLSDPRLIIHQESI